jgi:CHAT domain-containing protein/Tfp pilus assembly protein PilF
MAKSLSTVAITAIFILLSISNCYSISNDEPSKSYSWQEMMDSCNTHQQAQDFQTALKWALQAEVKAKEEFGEIDTNYINSLSFLTNLYYDLGSPDSAIFYLEKSLFYSRKYYHGDHIQLAFILNSSGVIYQMNGNHVLAESLYTEALAMRRRLFKTDHPDLAQSLNNLGCLYHESGKKNEAEKFLNEALDMRKRIYHGDHLDIAQSYNFLSLFYNDYGLYEKAVFCGREALDIRRRLLDSGDPAVLQSMINLASYLHEMGNNYEAEQFYNESLDLSRNYFKNDHSELAICINNVGLFYQDIGDFTKAELLLNEALEMRRRLFKSDHWELANGINNLAYFYHETGKYSLAEPLYKESLDMERRIYTGDNPRLARALNNMGAFYEDVGNLVEAEKFYKDALVMYRHFYNTDHLSLANSINSLGSFYHTIGNKSESEKYYIEAFEMRKRLFNGDHPHIASSLNNLAGLYDDLGDYKKADSLMNEALEMRKRLYKTDNVSLSNSIHLSGCFYLKRGNFQKGAALLHEAIEMKKRLFHSDHPSLANSISRLGDYYNKIGNFGESEKLLLEALEMRKRLLNSNHPDLEENLHNLAYNYYSNNKYSLAYEFFHIVYPISKSNYSNQCIGLSEIEKEKLLNSLISTYDVFHSVVIKSQEKVKAFYCDEYDNLLFTKGILLSSFKKFKALMINSSDENTLKLYKNWLELKKFNSKNSSLTNDVLRKKHINLDSMEILANNMEKELTLMSSLFNSQLKKTLYSWRDIKKTLKKNEAAIELVRFKFNDGRRWTDTIYYAALILKHGEEDSTISFVLLENGNELEQLHIKNYKNCIKNKFQDNESYNQFWEMIATKLKGVKKVYVSPDGVYNQLNLTTLYNPKSKKYLLEEMEIQVVTSTRDLVANKEQKKPEYNNNAVLIGNPRFNLDNTEYKKVASSLENKFKSDYYINEETELSMRSGIHPLPGTGVEIDKISQLLTGKNWNVEKYTDNLAIEEVVKKVDNPRILHIATHGKFLSDVEREYSNFDTEIDRQRFVENPLLRSYLIFAGADRQANPTPSLPTGEGESNIVLQPDETEDGFLTAYEAQNLYLDKTELVVLSACETGLGEIKNGEGVYGLQRAFIQAGAKSIIMSLWSVSDDATQELMTSFYTKWLSGKPKRQAFKEAQLELKSKYQMPYYWGAFVMVG